LTTRDILISDEFEELLTENSKKIIDSFLMYYKESSRKSMRSSVNRLLYELGKEEVSKVNFEDYLKIFPNDDKELSTQESYKQTFFKFLYAFEHIEKPLGFETKWIKDKLKKQFIKRERREEAEDKNTKSPRKTLTIEELMSIQKVIEANSTKLETLKMQFCWFAIFELGLDISELRNNITSDNFSNGMLHTKDGSFEIPEKYHYMFEMLSNRDSNYNGFATLDAMIENLGNYAKLDRKLLPSIIKLTRKAYMVSCGNCGKEYTHLSRNWFSVNNRIVCVDCADKLKKN
jgi:hypothetical protein